MKAEILRYFTNYFLSGKYTFRNIKDFEFLFVFFLFVLTSCSFTVWFIGSNYYDTMLKMCFLFQT